jgi:molybdopterin molybdotransferase
MHSVSQALQDILNCVVCLPSQGAELADALGLVLAVDVVSGGDSPPFDKSMMDGYAVRFGGESMATLTFRVVGEVTAGNVHARPLQAGEAVRIMTGAPTPEGAQAVVRIEDAVLSSAGDTVSVRSPIAAGGNIIRRGTSMRSGERVLPAGRLIRPQEIAALAELGHARVDVYPRPGLAVLSTGDELVPVGATPGAAQIRNSNGPMLAAQALRRGCDCRNLGIARDDRAELEQAVRIGLQADILCLSGGVSAGKLDLVPVVLRACGVREVFHKVELKPGKPVWFGVLDPERSADGKPHYIFGLPGNPVSSMVCFELFVRVAINGLAGIKPVIPVPVRARMGIAFRHRDDRPVYFPSRIEWAADGPRVHPVNWKGSSDIRSTVEADAMVLFPPGELQFEVGDEVQAYPW